MMEELQLTSDLIVLKLMTPKLGIDRFVINRLHRRSAGHGLPDFGAEPTAKDTSPKTPLFGIDRTWHPVPSVMCGRPRRSKSDLVCCAAVGCGHVSGLCCAAL